MGTDGTIMVGGHPCTIIDGREDNGILADMKIHDIQLVDNWIRENIVELGKGKHYIFRSGPHRKISSYSMKHILENATRIYMTNNQFKDAMLLAGYKPNDPKAINWTWNVALKDQINWNRGGFFKYMMKEGLKAGGKIRDLAEDMRGDEEFPSFDDPTIISDYLVSQGACRGARDAFDEAWEKYGQEGTR